MYHLVQTNTEVLLPYICTTTTAVTRDRSVRAEYTRHQPHANPTFEIPEAGEKE